QTTYIKKLEASNAHLVAENARLKEHSGNVELLREEKRSLECKVRMMDELRAKLALVETKVEEQERERTEWERMLETGIETDAEAASLAASNPDELEVAAKEALNRLTLPRYLSTLRGAVSGLKARCQGLEASLQKAKQTNSALEEVASLASETETKVRADQSEMKSQLERASKAEQRLRDEIQRYKALLQSYETEERNLKSSYDSAKAERISMLEKRVEEQSQEIVSLNEQLGAARHQLSGVGIKSENEVSDGEAVEKLKKVEKALEESRTAYSELEREAEKLGEENDKLYARVGRGEFDRTKERCLVLTDNPVSRDLAVRTASLEALRKENAELLKRIDELGSLVTKGKEELGEGGGGGERAEGASLVPRQMVENLKIDIQALQESIKAKDKAMLRLKQ
ncbi:hypothetical protein IE53DRAFT_372309, partial [Violaceomyces palustris]